MAQTNDEFRDNFNRFLRLAHAKTWVPVESPCSLRLTRMDSATSETFPCFRDIRDRLRSKHGVDLNLVGGGYGCFDLGFAFDGPKADALVGAFDGDTELHKELNKAGVHTARVVTPEQNHAYCGLYDSQMLIATNRNEQVAHWDSTHGVRGAFGAERDKHLHFRLAQISIGDLTKRQAPASMGRRVWRTVSGAWLVDRFRKPYSVLVRSLDTLATPEEFKAKVNGLSGKGAVVLVHGYANSFDDAVDSCAIGAYKTRYEQLDRVPVLFSWPARGSALAYESDQTKAKNSQRPFLEALELVVEANTPTEKDVDLMAHSHGNELVINAICDKKNTVGRKTIRRTLFLEPDVNNEFAEERINDVLECSQRVALYHSENDKALLFSQLLHSGFIAGRKGVSLAQVDADFATCVEVIDASSVARGLMKHAPHIDSAEVIRDIHDVLAGQVPPRFGIRKAQKVGYWEMNPQ